MKTKKIKTVIDWTITIIIAMLFILVMGQRISGKTPVVFGFSVYKVATDSMEPEIMVGDVILVKNEPISKLEVGNDITYYSDALNGQPVTHRMISMPYDNGDGTYTLYTKGIREGAAADAPFSSDKYIGKVITKLAVLTFIYGIFSTKIGIIVILLPLLGIIVYETIKIFKSKGDDKN